MPTIDFIFFDAGGGHRSAATALKAVIESQNRDWEIRLVNLQEVLDSLDIFRKVTGLRLEDVYNTLLAKGWTLGSEYMLPAMHGVIRVYHSAQVRVLTEHWRRTKPDLVVSLVPNFNRSMWQALRAANPLTPYVTVLTDMADYPPHFWMERQEQFFICGTERAVEQAVALGHSRDRIFHVSGMILRPAFYEHEEVDRDDVLRKAGFDPTKPVGLVLFGGQGSKVMLEIAERLSARQLILICGKNDKLALRLRAMKREAATQVVGFTSEVPHFMRIVDYFIGKPGPGSISEALRMRLPVIVERNAWTLPQERFNAAWVAEREVGVVLSNFRGIAEAVDRLLEPSNFATYRANAAAQDNRAAFEIPEIL
ncbi:MAG: glycosyltransferase, partial [Bryobacteraceae bacterium]